MTLKPLLVLLDLDVDGAVEREVSKARTKLMQAAVDLLEGKTSEAAEAVRRQYAAQRKVAENVEDAQAATEYDELRLKAIRRQRDVLEQLRAEGTIGDEAYHRLEEELDWAELAASPAGRFQPLNT
jgi:CPA1 family monovalent cation:H+ antiporter